MNIKKLARELFLPILFLIMSIYVFIVSKTLGTEGVFPKMVASVLFISSVWICFDTIKNNKTYLNFEDVNILEVFKTILVLMIYIFLFNKIGYVIDTLALCSYIMISLGYKKYFKVFDPEAGPNQRSTLFSVPPSW